MEDLWTGADLAKFLGYSVTSIASMATKFPHRLPPRVAGLGRPRWVPSIVREWAIEQSASTVPIAPRGRPRKTPQID